MIIMITTTRSNITKTIMTTRIKIFKSFLDQRPQGREVITIKFKPLIFKSQFNPEVFQNHELSLNLRSQEIRKLHHKEAS